jgi:hypothetical protein
MTIAPPKETAAPANGEAKPAAPVEVPAVQITLRNAGTKYLYLQNLDFEATGTDQSGAKVKLPAWDQTAIIDAAGVTLVEPGAERTFKLPLRNGPDLKSVSVEIRRRPQL